MPKDLIRQSTPLMRMAESERGQVQQAKVDEDAGQADSPRSTMQERVGSLRKIRGDSSTKAAQPAKFFRIDSPSREGAKSALVEAAERIQEFYVDSAENVPQAQSSSENIRRGTSVHRVLERPQVVAQKPQIEQFQSQSFFCELHDSMTSLHTELAQMCLNVRSIIRDELSESVKDLKESMKSVHAERESRTNSAVRSIIRAELRETMTEYQTSHSTRSVIHDELEEFMKQLSERGQPWKPSLSPVAAQQNISMQSLLLHDQWGSVQHGGPMSNAVSEPILVEEKTSECPKNSKHITSLVDPALEEPLLSATACEKQLKHTRPFPTSENTNGSCPPIHHATRSRSVLNIEDQAKKDKLKETLESALAEDGYNVEDLYHESGPWQAMARQHSWFSYGSLVVVAANVIWIGIDEDLNQADVLSDAPLLSQVMNNIFCTFFTFEVVVHFLAFKEKINALRDGKFLFDLILVGFMVWETWLEVIFYKLYPVKEGDQNASNSALTTQLFRFFRLFRLTRVPRIARLCLAVPELMIMMKGIAAAMRSVLVIIVFLLFTIYVFGVLFTELLKEVKPFTESFGNVRISMYTLLLQVLCGVDADFLNDLFAAGLVYYMAYLVFLFMAVFTLLNMLIGVLCDVVSDVREAEVSSLHARALEHEISLISEQVDKDGSGSISHTEFEQIMNTKSVLRSLHGMGVDVVSLAGLGELIFKEDGDLSLSEFCQMVTHFNGKRVATLKDLLDTHKFINMELTSVVTEVKRFLEASQLASFKSNSSLRSCLQ